MEKGKLNTAKQLLKNMVGQNLSFQDISYTELLQSPGDSELLILEELKPYHLTELGFISQTGIQISKTRNLQDSIFYNSPSLISTNCNKNLLCLSEEREINERNERNDYNRHNYDSSERNGFVNSMYISNDEMTNAGKNENHNFCPNFETPSEEAIQNQSQEPNNQPSPTQSVDVTNTPTRKRKISSKETSDMDDDDVKSTKTNDETKKQNHSEIEKRRRDKMNTYITKLSTMIPMCHSVSRKLDKLTVLRMAVQHMKTIRGTINCFSEDQYKPKFISDQELKTMILQAADGFLFVVGCDQGRILYVSESIKQVLKYTQNDLLGQSLFDVLHPKDVAKVKEQLSSLDLNARQRLIDAKTMLPVRPDGYQNLTQYCSGARRSFFCRMKYKTTTLVKEERETSTNCQLGKKSKNLDMKYGVIQCTGYLKSWPAARIGLEEQDSDAENENCNYSCLVAIGRKPSNIFDINYKTSAPCLKTIQFVSRHTMDGKFLFVDQKATLVLGYLPQELLGTSMYEYYHHDDIPAIAESHKMALQTNNKITTLVYRFRTKENEYIHLQSQWKSFKNPWTKDIEYLISKNVVILNNGRKSIRNQNEIITHTPGNFELFEQSNVREIQRIINTHVEASKIGRQIAEKVMDYQRRKSDSSSENSMISDNYYGNRTDIPSSGGTSTSENSEWHQMSHISKTKPDGLDSHFPLQCNSFASSCDNANDGQMQASAKNSSLQTNGATQNNDGGDETAMAVIMSLLEADAGLCGPFDFAGLPWPIP